jgi:hypothetical protein
MHKNPCKTELGGIKPKRLASNESQVVLSSAACSFFCELVSLLGLKTFQATWTSRGPSRLCGGERKYNARQLPDGFEVFSDLISFTK